MGTFFLCELDCLLDIYNNSREISMKKTIIGRRKTSCNNSSKVANRESAWALTQMPKLEAAAGLGCCTTRAAPRRRLNHRICARCAQARGVRFDETLARELRSHCGGSLKPQARC
uniref:Uncharacterized protein n=1 Tax=Trichogramma kaykai TaxID=54128 RepID=A0ABD2X4L4_9HYME